MRSALNRYEITNGNGNYFNGKLKHAARVKVNFSRADFWLVRKGGINKVGEPTREFSAEHIGVKAFREKFNPQFLFYLMTFLFNEGAFKPLATGTTDLQNIRVEDVKKMSILNGLINLSDYTPSYDIVKTEEK